MYSQKMQVKDEHIDFQGILDGLYYPYYMEKVRHDFMKEVYNIDIVEAAKEGNLYVLTRQEIDFKRPLKKGDEIEVTAELVPVSAIKFGFKQKITSNGLLNAEGVFYATCYPASGGRPFIPNDLKEKLKEINNN